MTKISKEKIVLYQSLLFEKLNTLTLNFHLIEKTLFDAEKKLHILEKKEFHSNPIAKYLILKEDFFQIKEKKKIILNPFYESILNSEKSFVAFISFLEEYEHFTKELSLNKINLSTINNYFLDIDKYIFIIKKQLVFIEEFSINDYLLRKSIFNKNILEIKKKISMITNIIFNNFYYQKNLDLKNFKKISYNNIRVGDIILKRREQKENTRLSKLINIFLDSPIVHVSLVYRVSKDACYTLEVDAYNNTCGEISKLKVKNTEDYIIMRSKKLLSKEKQEKIKLYQEEFLTRKYSILKVIGAFIQRHKERIFSNIGIFSSRKKNIFSSIEGIFCSQVAAEVYKKAGIELGLTDDTSVVSPLDILNSPQLKIVGYLKNEN